MSKQLQHFRVPLASSDVAEKRAARIGHVGDVMPAGGQIPHEPTVDGAEGEFAALSAAARSRHMLEQPGELRGREVGIEQKPRAARDLRLVAGRAQRCAELRRAPILPDDRTGNRFTAATIPKYGSLALIREAERGHVGTCGASLGEYLGDEGQLLLPDLARVMLDPARLREVLGDGALSARDCSAVMIKENGARTCRALVERKNEVAHRRAIHSSSRCALPGGVCKPSLVRRQRMSSALRAHSVAHRYSASRG